ncbi:uncharacterized protein KGF55_005195 [Candida pseudojiufengensis]|uniref:uncharacterized protein n=1 Tax=Candida pseudojiufengensis TaxID=497109 RepID=UPI002225B1DA|nr:uncharacterized protein KGF55_005195 [Candida pseudojiufengensis]KAI5959551.1 hypothetical protein KGF55_005195 [Candida pseudojiufengensis]
MGNISISDFSFFAKEIKEYFEERQEFFMEASQETSDFKLKIIFRILQLETKLKLLEFMNRLDGPHFELYTSLKNDDDPTKMKKYLTLLAQAFDFQLMHADEPYMPEYSFFANQLD